MGEVVDKVETHTSRLTGNAVNELELRFQVSQARGQIQRTATNAGHRRQAKAQAMALIHARHAGSH